MNNKIKNILIILTLLISLMIIISLEPALLMVLGAFFVGFILFMSMMLIKINMR